MNHSTVASASRLVSVGRCSELLGVSPASVRRFCDRGELEFVTTPGGTHRRISLRSINRYLGFDDEGESTVRKCCTYSRVSGRQQQRDGNLERQAERLRTFCIDELGDAEENIIEIAEQGSGLSETRPGYLRLLDLVISGRIRRIVVEHRDRLARYGVVVLETLCQKFDVEIIVTNKREDVSEDEEMTADILSLVTVYAARRHGKRGGETVRMPLSDSVKERILELHRLGVSQDEIAQRIQDEGHRCEKTGKLFKIHAVRMALKEHAQLKRATESLRPSSADTLQQFIREKCIVANGETRCFTAPLHRAVESWSKAKGVEVPTSRQMTARLKRMGFSTATGTRGFMVIEGIALKDNPRASETYTA